MYKKIKIYDDFALCDTERKIIFDKSFATELHLKKNLNKEIIKHVIKEVKYNGPAGLFHILILSKILKRQIRIWKNDTIVNVLGKANGKTAIDVEFKEYLKSNSLVSVGHWTLRNGNNPVVKSLNINNCLYEVIASQTGINPTDLRHKIIRIIRKNEQSIGKFILASIDPVAMINSMLGGASYTGSSAYHAKIVLDASQNELCHPEGRTGHPRGHASYPSAIGSENSVELYSLSRWRSGFLSRDDQDLVAHYALITNEAINLMDKLNSGQLKADCRIRRNEIDYDPLPFAQIWDKGIVQGTPRNFVSVCLVGKHFLNKHRDVNANIFVLTFYPIL